MNPEGLLLLSIAFWLLAVWLHYHDSETERRDARRRNPERTWEDRP